MLEANPGWCFQVTDADGGISTIKTGAAEASYDYKLYAGDTYSFEFWAYNKAGWDYVDGTIGYTLTFVEGEHQEESGDVEKAASVISDDVLVLGSNELTLSTMATTTIFEFAPTESGVYTFTAPEGVTVGYWGGSPWFLTDPNSSSNSCEWTCTGVGQSAYIGVSCANSNVTLTVVKSGEGGGNAAGGWVDYVNEHTPEVFAGELINVKSVDVTKSHSAVLGTDGYYHLDSADGPRLYAKLNDSTWSLVNGTAGALTLRGVLYDENGNTSHKYEFLTSMKEYTKAVNVQGYYPLTVDLITFMQAYGNAQGWWRAATSPFYEIQNGKADADTQWMVLCCYVPEA